METGMTIETDDQMYLPPGFRFHPTDEELLVQYLLPKTAGVTFTVNVIADVDLYKYDPWDLPVKALFGDKEWYFFSPRDRRYPNGSRPNRSAGSGYWKATGTDRTIVADGLIAGIKKSLVFYIGKAPNEAKTNWIMHEYRLLPHDNGCPAQKKRSTHWDDWVLCRIYKKRTSLRNACSRETGEVDSSLFDAVFSSLPDINNQLAEYYEDRWSVPEMAISYEEQQFPNNPVQEVPNVFCTESRAYVRDSMVVDSSSSMQQIHGYYPQQQQQQPDSYLAGQYQWSRSPAAPMEANQGMPSRS